MSKNAVHELMKEARKGHLPRVKRLLARGVDVNSRAKFGQTALFEAVLTGQVEMVHYLLDHGANPQLVSNDGAGPLYFACVRGHADIVALLIAHGANANETRRTEYRSGEVDCTSAIDVAKSKGHFAIAERLVRASFEQLSQRSLVVSE